MTSGDCEIITIYLFLTNSNKTTITLTRTKTKTSIQEASKHSSSNDLIAEILNYIDEIDHPFVECQINTNNRIIAARHLLKENTKTKKIDNETSIYSGTLYLWVYQLLFDRLVVFNLNT
ncbi:hypothetical protein BpHYR1_037511 [Brachionus plicatilis]|uniref:Uncharacterized protein n=1 Tax=Brachionus plicatilis TaxID=10195 RepID=A0A3M7PFF6_BRAPC|nr:hypothetical protein BpHYR1_037511 [Brachionus plicatilis]